MKTETLLDAFALCGFDLGWYALLERQGLITKVKDYDRGIMQRTRLAKKLRAAILQRTMEHE
jgi:hypothetical protein